MPREAEMDLSDFRAIATMVEREARISLSPAKLSLVQSRLARRLRSRQLPGFSQYVRLVEQDREERSAMIAALTTNHTSFFREAHHFDHLRSVVLPEWKARATAGRPVRIWSAGCSSGEEIYTIAMCLLGQDEREAGWLRGRDVRLLATDISQPMVSAVERATYSALAADSVPLAYRATWMREEGGDLLMADLPRKLVSARVLNLFSEWPMRQRYDAIFCRNVMIYFDDASRQQLELRLLQQLAPGGFLYIGHSERLTGPASQLARSCGQTIYVKD